MTKEQFQWALKKVGVTDVNNPTEIMKKVRRIEFNNSGGLFLNPKDKTSIIKEIDWTNEMIVMMTNDSGKWRPFIKAIELVEAVVGLAKEISPDGKTYILEDEDGNYTNTLATKENMSNDCYKGSVIEQARKIGN